MGDHAGRVAELKKNKVATRRDLSPRFGDRYQIGITVGCTARPVGSGRVPRPTRGVQIPLDLPVGPESTRGVPRL